jgi:hypothetical protein
MPHPISTPAEARTILLAGDATFTVVSARSGTRYTFNVSEAPANPRFPRSGPAWFAKVLTGPENTSDYTYLGMLTANAAGEVPTLRLTKASTLGADSAPVKGLGWLFDVIRRDDGVAWSRAQVWHADTCARCGRALTTPESVAARLGPECRKMLGVATPKVAPEAAPEAAEAAPAATPAPRKGRTRKASTPAPAPSPAAPAPSPAPIPDVLAF